MARSYYDILGVAEDANEEALRNGYLKAMRDKHPDLHSGDDARADRRVRELNAARDTLTNQELRCKYNQQLQKMKEATKAVSNPQTPDSTPPTQMDPGKDNSDQDAAEQRPFVNTESEFCMTKPRSVTTCSRRSFAATGQGIVSILFGGVAGIYIAIVMLWTIWEVDPLGIINREQYRLLTEAGWEHAYRAGTITTYKFGDGESQLGQYGWVFDNSFGETRRIGLKLTNPWSLNDMHGHVYQWHQDWLGDYANGTLLTDPRSSSWVIHRMLRVGSFLDLGWVARSAFRGGLEIRDVYNYFGFRVARRIKKKVRVRVPTTRATIHVDQGEATLDVTDMQTQKKEVRQSMIGYHNTLLFYTFPQQKAVLDLRIDNKDKTFPVTGKVYLFDQSVTADGLRKWLNNQYSDGLYADVPRPASTQILPVDVCAVTAHKLIGQNEMHNGIFDNYAVTLEVKDCERDGFSLQGFSVETKVHVKSKQASGSGRVLRNG